MCSTLDDASLQCWGRDTTLTPQSTPTGRAVGAAFSTTQTEVWLAESDGHIGTVSPPSAYRRAALEDAVTQIAAGSALTCALLTTHRVRCWPPSANHDATLPALQPAGLVDAVSIATAPLIRSWTVAPACAVRATGTVACWDLNGVVTELPTITDAVQIAAFVGAYCVRTRVGELWCWGDGDWIPQRGYGFIDVPWISANLRSAPVPGDA